MDLQAAIQRVLEAETDDFVELLQLSGLSPQEDLQEPIFTIPTSERPTLLQPTLQVLICVEHSTMNR